MNGVEPLGEKVAVTACCGGENGTIPAAGSVPWLLLPCAASCGWRLGLGVVVQLHSDTTRRPSAGPPNHCDAQNIHVQNVQRSQPGICKG